MTNCPQCGAEIPPGSSFCPQCGSQISSNGKGNQGDSDISADSTASSAEVPEQNKENGIFGPPKIEDSRDEAPHRDGDWMPPEVRGDDYKHPLSVHGSNKKWIVIAAVIILGVLAVGLMLRANETTSDDNVPLTGFRPQLSYEETVGEYIASPEPTYSVLAVVENIGEDAGSLDDWNVHVKLEVNRGVVAEDREYLKGSLGPDETWDIPFELKIDELETGDKIRLLVYLRDEEDGRYSSRMIRQTITEE